jgi:hypothetical protein
MVRIEKDKEGYLFIVVGVHKLLALKNAIHIPFEDITKVHTNLDVLPLWKGWKLPGTHLPYVITSGSFYRDGSWTFWDVCNRSNAIIVELSGNRYTRLVVEVENVQQALNVLQTT